MAQADDSLVVEWRPIPPFHLRRMKTQCEEELLDKLGVRGKGFVVHPLIQREPLRRSLTRALIDYRCLPNTARVGHRQSERQNGGTRRTENEACRQLLQSSRRGPRNVFFSANKQHVCNTSQDEVQSLYEDQKEKARAAQEGRLETVFSSWRALRSRSRLNTEEVNKPEDPKTETETKPRSGERRLPPLDKQPGPISNQTSETQPCTGEIDFLLQKMSYWRQVKMAAKAMTKYHRDATNTREPPRSEVKIYVCSTPDLVEEREMISTVTQPEVQKYCGRYGIACHFVDLRLGADRLAGDHAASRMIRHEIHKCRRLSLGAAFLALIGEELDSYPIPLTIPADVYEAIRDVVLKEKLDDLSLLDEYYRLDSNNIPPIYTLQIEDALEVEHGDSSKDNIVGRLRSLLQMCCPIAVSRGKVHQVDVDRLNTSVTHKELEVGLLRVANPERHAMCVLIDDKTYSATTTSDSDGIKNSMRIFFRDNAPHNILTAKVSEKKDKKYLRSLADSVVQQIMTLLEAAVRETHFDIRDHVGEVTEQLHHLQMANLLCSRYHAREELASNFKASLDDSFELQSVINVTGEAGVGKSSFLAKLTRLFPEWTNNACKVMIRFAGTSPESSYLYGFLLGLCHQLSAMFGLESLASEELFSTRKLIEAWITRLNQVSSYVSKKQPLVVLLDSVDTLAKPLNINSDFSWVPKVLPEGVVFVVSSKEPFRNELNHSIFIIPGLVDKEMNDIAVTELRQQQRKATSDQIIEMQKGFVNGDSVFSLKLGLANVVSWPSNFLPDLKELTDPIHYQLEQIEAMVGRPIAQYCLCYLVLSKFGITEKELIENMVRDDSFVDAMLSEKVGVSHNEILSGIPVHFGVSKLLFHCQEFLMEDKRDGQAVLLIKNADFAHGVLKRYAMDDWLPTLHRHLAKYFMTYCKDFILIGPTLARLPILRLHKLNLRLLRCVLYHFCRSQSNAAPIREIVTKQLFFNMHWFLDRTLSSPVQELLMDFEDALQTFHDKELEHFHRVILSSKEALTHDPFHVFVILADSLSQVPKGYPNLKSLGKQAHECLRRTDLIQLVPKHGGNLTPSSVLQRTFETSGQALYLCGNQKHVIVREERSVKIIDIHCGETVGCLEVCGQISVQEDLQGSVYICTRNEICIWDTTVCKISKRMIVNSHEEVDIRVNSLNSAIAVSSRKIRVLDFEDNKSTTVFSAEETIFAWQLSEACSRIFVLTGDSTFSLQFLQIGTCRVERSVHCNYMGMPLAKIPLLVTDDGRFVLVCFQYGAVAIDAVTAEIQHTFTQDNQCLVHSTLTQCNEHVILSDTKGSISIRALRNGEEVCTFELNKTVILDLEVNKISDLVVSEDDHFLCVGLTSGQFVLLHVPTQGQVVVLQASTCAINCMYFITGEQAFQRLLTCSETGVLKLWNLQDVIVEARQKVFPYIRDEDLLNEEKQKLNLNAYFQIYQGKRTDKTFLNGADVVAFFGTTPTELFSSVANAVSYPESKLTWLKTESLKDCREVDICIIGRYKDLMATSLNDVGVSIWDTTTGLLRTFIPNENETERVDTIGFLSEDGLLVVRLCQLSREKEITCLRVVDPSTGSVSWKVDGLLDFAVQYPGTRLYAIEHTTRDTHVRLNCFETELPFRKLWSSQLKIPPSVVKLSKFLCSPEAMSLVRFRDKSFEVRVLVVDVHHAPGDICTEQPNNPDTPQTEISSITTSSTRIFQFPVASILAEIRREHLVMVTQEGEVLLLNLLSGSTTRKFNLQIIVKYNPELFDFNQKSKFSRETLTNPNSLIRRISSCGTYIVLGFDNIVEVWSMQASRKQTAFKVSPGKLTALEISEDERRIVTGSSCGSVQVWIAESGVMECSFPALVPVVAIDVSRTGVHIAVVARNADERKVMLLDVKTPKQMLAE